ncbi:hypothetical protein P3T76_009243 [Phytophthora citrophthora]|uniref:Uncharacterized protein n=1 Tax=Phytophthora citrophthora TaxID=4793 RepID=A0AAD9LIL9_9STRA|nr:hypothetical protein P3T76_009243 [Phytophthora citrophthora]
MILGHKIIAYSDYVFFRQPRTFAFIFLRQKELQEVSANALQSIRLIFHNRLLQISHRLTLIDFHLERAPLRANNRAKQLHHIFTSKFAVFFYIKFWPFKMASEGSPSFSFTTPEQRRQRFPEDVNDADSEDWHFRNGPSPIVAPRLQGEGQDESKENYPDNFATSHFRRRNRLESRLEELQKDVASLTLKLRANGNRSTSLDASSFLYTPKEKVENKSYSVNKETSRKSVKDQGQNNTAKIKRELHHVTTERDQLKFELERTRKALIVAEKKSQEAAKSRKAYEKLQAHCDSLQESLDLSEKIRVRQKKLLQQLQLQQRTAKKEKEVKAEKKRPVSAGIRPTEKRSTATKSTPIRQEARTREYSPTGYDILNSLVTSHQLSDEEEDADGETHEQAPSEPTAAVSRSRTPRSVLKPTTPTQKQYRSDFDALLQVDAPQFSTRRPSRIATNTSRRRPSQTQVQQRDAMRQAARWARTRGAAVDISTSITQLPARKTPTGRPKNSFLAPTQASLRRLHDLPRRGDLERRPFVV